MQPDMQGNTAVRARKVSLLLLTPLIVALHRRLPDRIASVAVVDHRGEIQPVRTQWDRRDAANGRCRDVRTSAFFFSFFFFFFPLFILPDTPLLRSANFEAMKLLVAAGASVLEKDNENTGVVHYSANKGNLECFKVRRVCECADAFQYVLEHGAKPTDLTNEGDSPLTIAIKYACSPEPSLSYQQSQVV